MSVPTVNVANMSEAVRANLMRQREFFAGSPSKAEAKPEEKPAAAKKSRKKHTLTPDEAHTLLKQFKVSEDGNTVKIILGVEPSSIRTAQQKGAFVGKDGRVHFFTKASIKKAEQALEAALERYAHVTRSWGEVPLEVEMDFYFSYPQSTPKKHLHRIGEHCGHVDVDNVAKMPLDALTRSGYWADDCFINSLFLRKRRTTGPACIVIRITNLRQKFDALYADTSAYDNPTLFSSPSTGKPEETNPLSDLNTER